MNDHDTDYDVATVQLTDEDGNPRDFEIIDSFFFEGEQYAVLIDPEMLPECDCEDHEHHADGCAHVEDEGMEAYILQVVTTEETEEFLPIAPDRFEAVAAEAQRRLEAEEFLDEEDADEEPIIH